MHFTIMVKINILAQCIKLRYALSSFYADHLRFDFFFIRAKYMYIVTLPLTIKKGTEGICNFKLTSLDYANVTLQTQTGFFSFLRY